MHRQNEISLVGTQWSILIIGAVSGLALSWVVAGLQFDFSADLARARELGIVSSTVLRGYPKARDLVTYATVFGCPVLLSLLFWSIWARKRRANLLRTQDVLWDDFPSNHGKRWLVALALLAAFFVLAYFPMRTFYDVMFIPGNVKAWPFLGEEGEILAWVQLILNGGVYGKDFFCLYGPLMLYPLALLMKVFGASVAMARYYTFALDLFAYAIVTYLTYRVFRSKWIAVLFLLTYLSVYNHLLAALSPNTSYLRVAFGMLPLVLTYNYLASSWRTFLIAAGLATGASLLFSQEVGLCSTISVCSMLGVSGLSGRGGRKVIVSTATYLLFTLAGVLPFLIYQGVNGSLGAFWESLAGYPRLVTLGYGGQPFPYFIYAVSHPFEAIVFDNYWVLFTLIAMALSVMPSILLGRRDPLLLFRFSLLVFGALLYRSALGRSTISRAFYVALPAFTFLFLYLDNALTCLMKQGPPFRSLQLGRILVATGIIATIFVNDASITRNASALLSAAQYKWTSGSGTSSPESNALVPRLDVLTDDGTYSDVMSIHEFIRRKKSTDILMFPNEPIYYFLFNITPPSRYVMSYFAVTRGMRQEMVESLERRKPRYVIYNAGTWRIDNIPEVVQVPEVLEYLRNTYHPIEESGDLIILERNLL